MNYEPVTCQQENTKKSNPKEAFCVTLEPDGFFVANWMYSSNLTLFNGTGTGYGSSVWIPITQTGSSSAAHQSTRAKLAHMNSLLKLWFIISSKHKLHKTKISSQVRMKNQCFTFITCTLECTSERVITFWMLMVSSVLKWLKSFASS